MKLQWMQYVVGASDQHLCVESDHGEIAPVCGAPVLADMRLSDEETHRCPECAAIDLAGKAIYLRNNETGHKTLVRQARPAAHVGSLDPFIDISEKLRDLGCAYTLMIVMPGQQSNIRWWANVQNFGHPAIDAFAEEALAMQVECHAMRDKIEADGAG